MKRYKNVLPLQPNQRNCSIRKTSLRRSEGWFYICGLFQRLDPFAQGIRVCAAAEDLAFEQTCARAARCERLVCAAHAAAAGGGKRNDGLARQIAALQKRVDDGGRDIPPDGEADKNGVVVRDVRAGACDFRTGRGVLHLNDAAGLLVHPVEIGTRVGNLRFDCKQIGPDGVRQRLRQLFRYAGRRKISDKCFTYEKNLLYCILLSV